MCGKKLMQAYFVEIGYFNSLILFKTTLNKSLISSKLTLFPSYILNKGSGISPNSTFYLPIRAE
jgi:hypothetical protein